jgi:hypothetical protein
MNKGYEEQQSTGRNVSGDYVWCYPERDISGLVIPIIGRGYNVDDSKALAEYHRARLALYENKRGVC